MSDKEKNDKRVEYWLEAYMGRFDAIDEHGEVFTPDAKITSQENAPIIVTTEGWITRFNPSEVAARYKQEADGEHLIYTEIASVKDDMYQKLKQLIDQCRVTFETVMGWDERVEYVSISPSQESVDEESD